MKSNIRHGAPSRQRDVWRLVALGYSYKEIATHLGIKFETVNSYMASLRAELQVTNQVELALAAWQHGVVTNEDRDTRLAELRERLTSIGEY